MKWGVLCVCGWGGGTPIGRVVVSVARAGCWVRLLVRLFVRCACRGRRKNTQRALFAWEAGKRAGGTGCEARVHDVDR